MIEIIATAVAEVDGVPLVELTPWGVILFMVVAFIRGWVVPRQALVDQREDTKIWREAHNLSEQARLIQAEQMKILSESSETTNSLVKSIVDRARYDN